MIGKKDSEDWESGWENDWEKALGKIVLRIGKTLMSYWGKDFEDRDNIMGNLWGKSKG